MAKTKKDVQELIVKKALADKNFREALKADPKAVIAKETGIAIPDNIRVTIVEETPDNIYLVIPSSEVAVAEGASTEAICEW